MFWIAQVAAAAAVYIGGSGQLADQALRSTVAQWE